MKEIICIAIDDEPLALSVIQRFCDRMGGISLHCFSDPQVGLESIQSMKPQLVFLDIEMDEINGLEIARQLPQNCCFIFTTAYMQYALDGFELDAVDFLHKPFSYERFEKAVEKAFRRMNSFEPYENEETNLVVKQEYNSISIPCPEILYIEAMENYSKIYRKQKPYVLTRMNLKSLQTMLPEKGFPRVHRSFIINLEEVTRYTKKEVTLSNQQVIPIGRQYANEINELLQTNIRK